MSSINESGQFDDVDNSGYVSGHISVSTSATELKVGANKLTGRQNILVQNLGPQTIYFGPSGVSTTNGMPLYKDQFMTLPIGDNVAIYAITGSSICTVVVQEIS